MTGNRYLLDTNIVIALFAGESAIRDRLAASDDVSVPSIVIGELHYGAHKSGRIAENVRRVEEFAGASSVIPCDAGTGAVYGLIKAMLQAKGRPLPENDIWIASIARQHGLTVVSRDSHFNDIDQLALEVW
ncbi:MAG: type II toxin-antitoxin system VapC family toxin [Pyrinomonadaceae bacterium]